MTQLTMFQRQVFERFVRPGEVVEVRIPKANGKSNAWGGEWARGVVSGYFDDHAAFVQAVQAADRTRHDGIYFTLQPIDPRLLGRAFNRLRPAGVTTSDANVLAYRWIPVDLDPVRPAGVSSSDRELAVAMELRDRLAYWVVKEMGFSAPIRAMSGNGAHLLFRVPDLPVNDENKAFVRQTLEGLASRFNIDRVHIDTTVFNPARIWKLYGTTSRKGDPVPPGRKREGRPHRRAYIDDLGASE